MSSGNYQDIDEVEIARVANARLLGVAVNKNIGIQKDLTVHWHHRG
jgi:hypothetical protein